MDTREAPSTSQHTSPRYIPRKIEGLVRKYAEQYPVVAITGPRQSGKTTLVRVLFPEYPYVSLESMDNRQRAEDDPRQFFKDLGNRAILDEAQRVPSLFSYLQEHVDDPTERRQYILTGSHQFLLMERITQSLAGRIVLFNLFPFTVDELFPRLPEGLPLTAELLLKGFYPRIHAQHLDPTVWYSGYTQTYLERDVRSILNVSNLRQFETFLQVLAGNSGQILNKASLANRIGVSEPTVQRWISVLQTSGIVALLPPYHRNFNKRLQKSPKVVFLDPGLLCYLLGVRAERELGIHPLYGQVFESFIAGELYKRIAHSGSHARLYYWRDRSGHEIDLLIEEGSHVLPIEIKAATTYHPGFAKTLRWWLGLPDCPAKEGLVLYDGTAEIGKDSPYPCIPWGKMRLYV